MSIDEGEMAKRSKDSTAAIQSLLEEKSEIERWLRRLDMAGDRTPSHVRSKVQTDYTRRLEAVLEELQGYRAELDASLRSQRDARDGLQQQEADAEESLAEAELRHAVGEYDEEKWDTIKSEIIESLEKIRDELGAAQKEIRNLEAVLDAIDAPSEVEESREEQEEAPAEPPEDEGELEVLEELEAIPELDDEDQPAVSKAEGTADQQSSAFDEMAFLKSVISGDKSAESLKASGPRRGLEKQDSGERAGVRGQKQASGERPKIGAEGAGSADKKEGGPAKGSTTKTVKCAECGTLNLPTEWYCENCGAELTAL